MPGPSSDTENPGGTDATASCTTPRAGLAFSALSTRLAMASASSSVCAGTTTGCSGACTSISTLRADAMSAIALQTSRTTSHRSTGCSSAPACCSGSSRPSNSSCCTMRAVRSVARSSSESTARVAARSGARRARSIPRRSAASGVRSWCAALAEKRRSRASIWRIRSSRSFSAVEKGASSLGRSPDGMGRSDSCDSRFHCAASVSSGCTVRRTVMKIASIVAISSSTSGEKIQTMLRWRRSRLSRVSATSTVTPAQFEQLARTEATRTPCPAITASKARPAG